MERRGFFMTLAAGLAGLLLPGQEPEDLKPCYRIGEHDGFVHYTRVRMKDLKVGDRFMLQEDDRQIYAIAIQDAEINQEGKWSIAAESTGMDLPNGL